MELGHIATFEKFGKKYTGPIVAIDGTNITIQVGKVKRVFWLRQMVKEEPS